MTDLIPVEAEVVAYSARPVMTPEVAKNQADYKKEVLKAALSEGTDYDKIPGTPKPTLLKPGAEALLQFFGFGHHFEPGVPDYDKDGNKVGITYRCVVTKPFEGRDVVVSSCEGYASNEEKKWAKAPWNTIMKMAQKRALVGAALTATGTSGLLTSDLEDYGDPATAGGLDAVVDEVKKWCRSLDDPGQDHMRAYLRNARPLPDMTAAELAQALIEVGKVSAGGKAATAEQTVSAGAPASPAPPSGDLISSNARKKLFAECRDAQLNEDERHALAYRLTDGRSSSFSGLFQSEVDGMLTLIADVKAGKIGFQEIVGESETTVVAVEVTE